MRIPVGLFILSLAHAALAQGDAQDEGGSLPGDAAPRLALPTGVGDARPLGRNLGVGAAIGSPSGVAGKYFLTPASSLSFIAGFWGTEHVALVLDYLFHPIAPLGDGPYGTPFLSVGFGVATGLGGPPGAGLHGFVFVDESPYSFVPPGNVSAEAHGTFGLGWSFRAPVDLFFEVSPGVLIVPSLQLGNRVSFGGRWYL